MTTYNTDIDISSFKSIDNKIINDIDKEFKEQMQKLPIEFNWVWILKSDNKLINKKKLMSQVKNQYLCGCCWAIACATAISDAFVIKGLVDFQPKLSYTYALSKYPQQKCNGGSSRILLEDIKNGGGISNETCVDEKWCLNNKDCLTLQSQSHFNKDIDKEYLSALIPSEGCYEHKKHYIYEIDDVYSISHKKLSIIQIQNIIKKHIIVRGPVVAGILIMSNFPSGLFTKIPETGGIYIEDKDETILGSHSVVILGWGVQKNILLKGEKKNVPYWFCRNSWGNEWGEHGYFKIAMFPYNRICQISKKIKITLNGKIKDVGGVTGFNVIKKPYLKKLKSNNWNYIKNLDKKTLMKECCSRNRILDNYNVLDNTSTIIIIALIITFFKIF